MVLTMRLSKGIAILGILGLMAVGFWIYWDYTHFQIATVEFKATLEEEGTVHWRMIEPGNAVWGQPLSDQVEAIGEVFRFGTDKGGRLRVSMTAANHTLVQWLQEQGLEIELGTFRLPSIDAPSLIVTADEPARALIPMSPFEVVSFVYREEIGGVLIFRGLKQSDFGDDGGLALVPEAIVTGEPGSGFRLRFDKGYHVIGRSVEKSQDGPSGQFFSGNLLWGTLSVSLFSEKSGYDFSRFWLPGPRAYVIIGEYGAFGGPSSRGQATVHTKVREAAVGLNPGSLAIEKQEPRIVEREKRTFVEFSGDYGGELEIDSNTGKLRFFGKAKTVKVSGEEQLSRRLDQWVWYKQWMVTFVCGVLIIQRALVPVFRRLRRANREN